MSNRESYVVLGLDPGASLEEVKMAYRKLAKQYHPDKTGEDDFLSHMFRKINMAYEEILREHETKTQKAEANTSWQYQSQAQQKNIDPALQQWIENRHQILTFIWRSKNQLTEIQHNKPKKNLSFSRIAQLMGITLFILLFFYPYRTERIQAQTHLVKQTQWRTTTKVKLYQKPDIKTTPITELAAGQLLDSLGVTNYFFKVNVATAHGVKTGYILKDKLTK